MTHKFFMSRLFRNAEETIGIFSHAGRVICHCLEDEKRMIKVWGEMRIFAGVYRVTLRTVGGKHNFYKKKFGDWHKGMLWIREVKTHQWVLIHIGNDDEDTDACLLTGIGSMIGASNRYRLAQSTVAYRRLYPLMATPLVNGDTVLLDVRDEQTADIYDWKQ